MLTETIPLSRIVEAPSINPRRAKSDVGALKANILARGVMQKPAVRLKGAGYQIVFGNRRLRALRELAKEGLKYPGQPEHESGEPAAEVVLIEAENDGDAQEIALAENVQREQLHPIDEYEAFARLVEEGQTAEAIALRFGMSARGVKQRLALGALAPEIREAWRKGVLDDADAQAFTLIADLKRQKQVYADLSKRGALYAHNIRAAAGADHDAAEALKIVGADAYRAAGGSVAEDLFGQNHAVSDAALAKRLLAEKIEVTCRELEADGWSFAIQRTAASNWYMWPKLTPKVGYTADERKRKTEAAAILLTFSDMEDDLTDEQEVERDAAQAEIDDVERQALLRAFKPDLRKQSGCLVHVSGGALRIEYGYQKPSVAKAASKTAEKAKQKDQAPAAGVDEAPLPEPALSAAVITDLSTVRTVAAAIAVESNPDLALALLVATFEYNAPDSPLKVSARGMPALTPDMEDDEQEDFDIILGQCLATDRVTLLGMLARHVARSLDMRIYNPQGVKEENDALVAAIDPDVWGEHARARFDPQMYFPRIPLPLIASALREMWGPDYQAKGKKAELVAAAIAKQQETGWLPQQLRHPSQIGAQS